MPCDVIYLGLDLAWRLGTGSRPANESGVVALSPDGAVRDAGWTRGLSATIAWIESQVADDVMLFVDAPLVVSNPSGQRLAERQVGQRYGAWDVSANSTNLASKRLGGVELRRSLAQLGWRYDDGRCGPPTAGRVVSECYPYTTLVGTCELGYADRRPRYKRKPKRMPIAAFRPDRAATCDDLIRRMASLSSADPPLRLDSHPVTRALLEQPSPPDEPGYKHREDLIDAAICAWTASLWHRYGHARCQVLGTEDAPDGDGLVPTIIAPARPSQRWQSRDPTDR
jgi:predicted RNase H-like nuclease